MNDGKINTIVQIQLNMIKYTYKIIILKCQENKKKN